ncbi:hypothetical protein [Micromonospora sp. SH-82]|uniref:hypothetical protein n=1 Tax=Micromonospora sp. SH-82 TaxID=3132938 RepID=UPI003EBB962A
MIWDVLDPVASVVTGVLALTTAGLGVARHLRHRTERGWWAGMAQVWLAQQDDALGHPYRFAGGYLRPLSEVYVTRRVVRRSAPAASAVATDSLVTDPTTGHVLVIGEPGSGKSALLRQACATSAGGWLAARGRSRRTPGGAPVAVTVPAYALVGRSLAAALAEAYPQSGVDFTRAPVPGRRWLVGVDGVDAIADPDERAQVLNRLAALATPDAGDVPWRLLVTTRQLPEAELAVLGRGFEAYHLVPFEAADVRRFAHLWFTPTVAEQFLTWAEAERATVALRNPLTATVAAVVWETGPPGDAPPGDPSGLLDRFVGALLDAGRPSADTAVDALRRAPRGGPVADWLSGRHTDLVEVAATAASTGGDPVAAVVAWAAERAPLAPQRVLPDWPRHVRLILLATGLFSPVETGPADAGGRLAPTWPGPVEYLAAGPLARDWRQDVWIAAMTSTSGRGLGLHAWSRGDLSPELLRGLGQDPAGAIAAGHYLVAGGVVDQVVRADVFAALLVHGAADRSRPAADGREPGRAGVGAGASSEVRDVAGECHALLVTLAAVRADRDLLRAIAVDPARPTTVRRAAALFFAARRHPGGEVARIEGHEPRSVLSRSRPPRRRAGGRPAGADDPAGEGRADDAARRARGPG